MSVMVPFLSKIISWTVLRMMSVVVKGAAVRTNSGWLRVEDEPEWGKEEGGTLIALPFWTI